ncbi:MAG TPA: addiction module protein [Urbifossiella sp.]|jgi:putative addiction module component (TIGR02574 family)|nr:addiction module protein [Urbifossiella sp.]
MPSLLQTLGLTSLSPADRLALLGELWDSLTPDPTNIPLTDAQKADLDRRLAALDADPSAGSPWEEVKARLLGRSRS